MSLFTIILLCIGAAVVLLCLIGWSLTPRWKLEERITIEADQRDLFAYLQCMENWEKWTIWNKETNPDFITHYLGPKHGEGSKQCWKNKKQYGYTVIKRCDNPHCIDFMMFFGQSKSTMEGKIDLLPRGTSTEVVWSIWGNAGNNPLKRIMSRVVSPYMRQDFRRCLDRLKGIMA